MGMKVPSCAKLVSAQYIIYICFVGNSLIKYNIYIGLCVMYYLTNVFYLNNTLFKREILLDQKEVVSRKRKMRNFK